MSTSEKPQSGESSNPPVSDTTPNSDAAEKKEEEKKGRKPAPPSGAKNTATRVSVWGPGDPAPPSGGKTTDISEVLVQLFPQIIYVGSSQQCKPAKPKPVEPAPPGHRSLLSQPVEALLEKGVEQPWYWHTEPTECYQVF